MWRAGELSLAYLTVDGARPVAHVEAAGAAGFDAAGVRIKPPAHLPQQSSLVGAPEACRCLSTACRKIGVGLLDAEVMCLAADTRLDDLRAFVDTASELGFRFVQTVVDDENVGRAGELLAKLAELAGRAGLGVALEFMAFRPLRDVKAAMALIDATGSENIALIIDALHLARSGGSPALIADIPPQKLALAQLCDAPLAAPDAGGLAQEARTGRLHPGEGGLWLNALLDVLPDGLPISLEVPHPGFGTKGYEARARDTIAAFRRFLAHRS